MGIKRCVFLILIISISLFIFTVSFDTKKEEETYTLPFVTFINSTMYDINEKQVEQIIQSKKAFNYETKNELYDATVVLRTKDKGSDELLTDTVSAKYMEITDELLKFRGDVRYNRSSLSTLNSDKIDYDRIKKELIGNQEFTAHHEGSKIKGKKLFIKKDRTIFKGDENTPVKLDIIMDKKKDKNATN